MIRLRTLKSQRGFTILELLIATSVLAVVLLMATVIITSIGKLYYKGIINTQTQTATRAIVSDVSQDIQLGSNDPTTGISKTVSPLTFHAECIGSVRYTYVLGVQLKGALQHVLWRDTADAKCNAVDLTSTTLSGGTELVPGNARLTQFSISQSPTNLSLFEITVGVAYGDDDLITTPTSGPNVTCKITTGSQFCATDTLATSVIRRIVGSS